MLLTEDFEVCLFHSCIFHPLNISVSNHRVFLQISYSGLRSFDPSVPLQRTGLVVPLPSNTTQHLFSQLHPGVTYQFSIRASTSKGFGQATTLNVSTNISGIFLLYNSTRAPLTHDNNLDYTTVLSVFRLKNRKLL